MICKVFYSWQSDLPNNINRGFIEQALETAAKSIRNDDSIKIEPVVDRDTRGVPGAPDIAKTILEKIEQSQVFVCDVSIVIRQKQRWSPNPNVLIELGYALKILGESKIIMVMNKSFGGPELLPFDLRMKRVITYDLPEARLDHITDRKNLTSILEKSLREIISNLDAQATKYSLSNPPAETQTRILWDEEWITKHRSAAKTGLNKMEFTGFMEVRFALSSDGQSFSQKGLLDTAERSQIRWSGRPIGMTINSPNLIKPFTDGIVFELINKDFPMLSELVDFYDYWSLRENGDFYLLRSFDEDARKQIRDQGIFFDTCIENITEILLYSACLYSNLRIEQNTLINIGIAYNGLRSRILAASPSLTSFDELTLVGYTILSCAENEKETIVPVMLRDIKADLVTLVMKFAKPLFVLFDFKEFEINVYEQIVNKISRKVNWKGYQP